MYGIINCEYKGDFEMDLTFIIIGVIFVLFLPFFIAKLCNSDKTVLLVSAFFSMTEVIGLVPSLINSMGISFPYFNMIFLNNNVAIWLFFINLFIVIWHNRKKLFK